MKKILLVLLCMISVNTFSQEEGCIVVTNEKLCIQLDWEKGPYVGAYSQNTIKFKSLKLSTPTKTVYAAPSASVQFFGWMNMGAHQHGTRPVNTIVKENGVYQNTKIFYMGGMKGTWQFKVKIGTEEFVLHTFDV